MNTDPKADKARTYRDQLAKAQAAIVGASDLIEHADPASLSSPLRDKLTDILSSTDTSALAAAQLALRTIRDNPAHSYEAPNVANNTLNGDTSALDAAIAEATKPMVDALNNVRPRLSELIRSYEERWGKSHTVDFHYALSQIDAALAQVKEGK